MSESYRRAGVDLDAARKAVARIREVAAGAGRPEVVEGVGGFAGLFRLGDGRLLAAATDGVGTKLEVARLAGRLDTVGIDLVAMSVNDVLCTGAEPIFFLDYLAVSRVEPAEVADIVAGVAEGCRRAGCALLGGETAEHPGTMSPGRFDLAGFAVGIVDEERLLGPHRVREDDVLVGVASTGLHSNGYSLVRRVLLEEAGLSLDDSPPGLGRTLGEELLDPTAIYATAVRELVAAGLVHAAAHVTGGGLVENVPRMLPEGLGAHIDLSSWDPPAVFRLIREAGRVPQEDMRAVFNLGVGMVLAVPPDSVEAALSTLRQTGYTAWALGRLGPGTGIRFSGS